MRRRAGRTRVFQAYVSMGTKLFCQYPGLLVAGASTVHCRAGGKRVLADTLRPSGTGAEASEWSGGGGPLIPQAVRDAHINFNSSSFNQ